MKVRERESGKSEICSAYLPNDALATVTTTTFDMLHTKWFSETWRNGEVEGERERIKK